MALQQTARYDDTIAGLAADLRGVLGRLHRRLRDQADLGDLTWRQIAVLIRLERDGPATVTMLAEAEKMRPQSMGAIVAVLKAQKRVMGMPDPADGRQTILSLTPACRKWIAAGRAARHDFLNRALEATLSPREQEKLAQAVVLLQRLADF